MDIELDKFLKDKQIQINDSIIISGEPRSGSTWLMELIYAVTNSLINWEPLHPKFGVVPGELKWGERPYIPEDDKEPMYLDLMKDILTLKRYSTWTLKYCARNDFIVVEQVLTKFVRANALLPWMVNNFSFKHKPIFLVRHPVAVALSQYRAFHKKKEPLQEFVIPDCINNEQFYENFDFISALETPMERIIALWCVNNLRTLHHQNNNKKWLTVYYENLLLQPQEEFKRILKEISLNVGDDLLNTLNFRDASSTDFKKTFLDQPLEQLNKWQLLFTKAELDSFQKIFDHFGLNIYSAYEHLPLK